jgi:hypothetical protein
MPSRFRDGSSAVGKWLSLVEHSVRDAGAGGSNPLFPTIPHGRYCEAVGLIPRRLRRMENALNIG